MTTMGAVEGDGMLDADTAQQRLAGLPVDVVDLLLTASVIGIGGDLAALAAAHGADTAELVDLVDEARTAQLIEVDAGRWRFENSHLRDTVYESAAASTRARRHRQVLEVLVNGSAGPPAVLAHHALAAVPVIEPSRVVALTAAAGEAALEQHSYAEATDWFGRALGAATGFPPDQRARLLVRYGEALRSNDAVGAAREAFREATAMCDDPEVLARAALGHASPGADLGIAFRTEDTATLELLDRAITAQAGADTTTMVQLESRLASELYFSDEPDRARVVGRRAFDRARRLGDERALVIAGAVLHDSLVVGQAPLDEQLAGSVEMLDRARRSGSTQALLIAHRARVLDLLAAGDVVGLDTEAVAFARIAEPLSMSSHQWWLGIWSAMRALLEGHHDLAEERALAAFRIGQGPVASLAFTNLSFLLFFLRREQGRLTEMERATREYAASRADVPAIRVSLAFLLAELERVDEARNALASFDAGALQRLHDRNWPASWFQLARAASLTGDRDLAATLLEPQHRPSERCVQVSLATACLGATDLAEAWLLQAVGDFDAADARYRSAADLNARIGARSWLAQTRADHGRLLLERRAAGDRDQAAHLLELAAAAAEAIGLATLDTGPAVESRAAPLLRATFRRDGAVWEIAYSERVVHLPDARGLGDIGYLLARQGEAVSVLELAGEPGVAATGDRGALALDDRARREIRAELRRLDDAESEAEAAGDGEGAALVREQRQELAAAVARDLGLGGRSRRVGDPIERARKTVSIRIRRTIAAIGRAHPELGRHLERSIDTGTWCAYRPAETVDWRT
jgi:tetratricopeptide (TPR) repeat protein